MATNQNKLDLIDDHRLVMDVIGHLHKLGYGKLKLYASRTPVGAWRHLIYASDGLLENINHTSQPYIFNTDPQLTVSAIPGESIQIAAQNFVKKHPDLVANSLGNDKEYTDWYAEMLKISGHTAILFMNSPYRASIGNITFLYPKTDSQIKDQLVSSDILRTLIPIISLYDPSENIERIIDYCARHESPLLLNYFSLKKKINKPFILTPGFNMSKYSAIDFQRLLEEACSS